MFFSKFLFLFSVHQHVAGGGCGVDVCGRVGARGARAQGHANEAKRAAMEIGRRESAVAAARRRASLAAARTGMWTGGTAVGHATKRRAHALMKRCARRASADVLSVRRRILLVGGGAQLRGMARGDAAARRRRCGVPVFWNARTRVGVPFARRASAFGLFRAANTAGFPLFADGGHKN